MNCLNVESVLSATTSKQQKLTQIDMNLPKFPKAPNMSCWISGKCVYNYAQDVLEFSISCSVAAITNEKLTLSMISFQW